MIYQYKFFLLPDVVDLEKAFRSQELLYEEVHPFRTSFYMPKIIEGRMVEWQN